MARAPRTLGRESIDEDQNDNVTETAERPEDSVETQLVETTTAEGEMEVEDADGEQLVEDIDQLIEHAEAVKESIENDGGMSEAAAATTEVAVECICNRWGFSRKKLGSENFRSGASRQSASKLGYESIIESVKSGFREVMRWIMKKISDLKLLWQKYVNVGKSSMGRIEKLRKKIDKLSGDPESGEKIEAKKIPKFVTSEGGAALNPTSAKDVGIFLANTDEAVVRNAENAAEAFDHMVDGSGANKGENGAIKKIELVTKRGGEAKFNRQFPASAKKEGRKIHLTFGGAILEYKDKNNILSYRWADITTEEIRDSEMPVLKAGEMDDLLNEAYDVASSLNSYFRKRSKTVNEFDKLKTKIEKAERAYGKASDKKDADSKSIGEKRTALEEARAAFENAVNIDGIYRKVATNFIVGAMQYVRESMKLYKDED